MNSDDLFQGPIVPASAWDEWKTVCTIGGCSVESAEALAALGRSRLKKPLLKLGSKLDGEFCSAEVAPQRAWLMLEEHLFAGREKGFLADGKRYKDKLLEMGGNASVLEAYVTRIFQRDIARRIAREDAAGNRNSEGRKIMVEGPDGRERPQTVPYSVLMDGAEGVADPDDEWSSWDLATIDNKPQGETEGSVKPDDPEDTDEVHEPMDAEAQLAEECEPRNTHSEFEPETEQDADEIRDRAESLAGSLWGRFSERQRLAILLSVRGMTVQEMLETGIFKCQKTQLSADIRSVKLLIAGADWGAPLGTRQRAFLTRFLLRTLLMTAHQWLEESEFSESLRFIEMEESADEGNLP